MRRIQFVLIAVAAVSAAGSMRPAAATSPNTLTAREQALFANANTFWTGEIAALGGKYLPAELQVFSGGSVSNACGTKLTFSGQFYCPSVQAVYLDQAYVQQLMQQARAPDFDVALALVIGHEMGRHIQTMIGTTELVEQARARSGAQLSRQTWITAALQADCYAGLWVHAAHMDGTIKTGANNSAALSAVAAVTHARDTRLAAGVGMPDPILDYATPAQRLKWFQRGLSGSFNDCDTFGAQSAGKL